MIEPCVESAMNSESEAVPMSTILPDGFTESEVIIVFRATLGRSSREISRSGA